MDKALNILRKVGSSVKDLATGLLGMARRRLGLRSGKKYRSKSSGEESIQETPKGVTLDVDGLVDGGEVKKTYNYNYEDGVDIGDLGQESDFEKRLDEGYYEEGDVEESDNFWEEKVTVTREDISNYKEKIEGMGKNSPEFEKVVQYYKKLEELKGKDMEAHFRDQVRFQVGEILLMSEISHVPSFLSSLEDTHRRVLEKVNIEAPEEEVSKAVMEELERHRTTYKEFISIVEEGDLFTFSDWKLGVSYINFIKEESYVSEMMLILTEEPLSEIVKTLREGYLPTYLEGTAFEKVGVILENYVREGERGEVVGAYEVGKAYETYKRGLPMYRRLRNQGKLIDLNKLLKVYYGELDKAIVKDAPEVDVYLGVVGKEEVILSYLEFFYGKPKQSEVMSDFVMRLMQEKPLVVEQLSEIGYALGDNPKGVTLYFTGHIVMYIETGNGKFNKAFDKAPSDILAKDVKTIASKFSADWGKK